MSRSDHYKFLPVRDAMKCVNQKVNMMAIILEFGLPRKSRGTDYCCTLKVIDESHQQPGMTVNIFAESPEGLPHVADAGDIIQLCKVMVKAHAGDVNAVYNKKFSSFALYGKESDDFAPYQVSSKFHPQDVDKNFIVKLRKLLVNIQFSEDITNFLLLRKIKEGDHCNLACKILHCCETANNAWMLFVWDGTDSPPNCITAKIEDELHDPLPLHLETGPLPRQILCTFPTFGSILRVTIDQGVEKSLIQSLAIDKWVKIVNLRIEVRVGIWHGVMTPFTKLRYTPKDDCLILDRLRLFDERVSLDWGRMPLSCYPWPSNIITVVDHENVLPVSLMDILTHSEVTAKFKCFVRAVAVVPWPAENLRSSSGIYRFRLTLEDPTARIHAFVYGEDGEKLLDGHPDNSTLTEKMNLLLGITPIDDSTAANSALRNPPWVQVCLKSYYTDPGDVWGSRQYRIFDTKIVGGP